MHVVRASDKSGCLTLSKDFIVHRWYYEHKGTFATLCEELSTCLVLEDFDVFSEILSVSGHRSGLISNTGSLPFLVLCLGFLVAQPS